jgi:hypothetical protein
VFFLYINILHSWSIALALESPFYTKSDTSTYWDQCFEHLECLGRGSFAEVIDKILIFFLSSFLSGLSGV